MLVVRAAGAPAPARRRLVRAKPKEAEPEPDPPTVPLTTLTAIRPEPLGDEDAARDWLADLRRDHEALEDEIDAALVLINEAIHAHRTAALDPHVADVSAAHALSLRVGYGDGEDLVDGRFAAAIEPPLGERRHRLEALRPQERVAAVLAGQPVAPSEELLLRARADLDAGRVREASLQLRVGLEALLAARAELARPANEEDLAALDERRRMTGAAANEALTGDLSPSRRDEVAETLRLCERVLRRERLGR